MYTGMNKIKFIDARQAEDVYRYKNIRCFNNVWVHLWVFMWYGWEFYFSQSQHLEGLSEHASDYCQIPVPQLYALLCLYEFLAQDKMTVIAWPPHLPHLVPCDFFLFPKFEVAFMWRRINDVSLIHAKLQNAFTKCQVMHFTDCFEWLHSRWAHCISQHWLDSKCYCFGEINSVLKLFDYSIHWTLIRLGKVYSVMTNTDIFSDVKFGGDLWK